MHEAGQIVAVEYSECGALAALMAKTPRPSLARSNLRIEKCKVRVTDLSGNVTELDAEIRSIDFMESVVSVERRTGPPISQ